MPTREAIDRHHPLAGVAILVLTATDWLTSRPDAGIGVTFDKDASLWGMLDVVNDRYQAAAVLAVIVIALAALVCLTFTLHGSRGGVLTCCVLAVAATGLVMLNTDGRYSPGPGSWLTLLISVAAAVLAVVSLASKRESAQQH